ncbi:hypothetical protein [Phyllobacterium sp. SB3]|uniref:hypothetical protein n=1 Tax=Phyllobacterium sp. SB3 TaxID=3156073 RepID=UPI0032AFDF4B
MSRDRHPKKEVENVLRELEALGWSVETRGGGHAWGLLKCPANSDDCRCGKFCQMTINSTPQNPGNHAAKLKQKALGCVKKNEKQQDQND